MFHPLTGDPSWHATPRAPQACPICVPLAAAQGQRSPEVTRRWQQALRVPCRCPDAQHDPLVRHPHVRPGCAGYTPLTATETSPMTDPSTPTCGAQYKALVDRLFPHDWQMTDDRVKRLWLDHPRGQVLYAAFALGAMTGEASKVALAACQAFMIRPAPDWWAWSLEAMQLVCQHYGLRLHILTAAGELWGVRPDAQSTLCHALTHPVNSPAWHKARGLLCGVPVVALDYAYHTRDTYGVRCEPERREP